MSSTGPGYGAMRCGTGLAYVAICIRASYAMSSTGLAYRAARCALYALGALNAQGTSLRACYAMSGTDILYETVWC
eukprot:3941554-Rhodomonas_salina.3